MKDWIGVASASALTCSRWRFTTALSRRRSVPSIPRIDRDLHQRPVAHVLQVLGRLAPPQLPLDQQIHVNRARLVPVKTVPEREAKVLDVQVLAAPTIGPIQKRTMKTFARHR